MLTSFSPAPILLSQDQPETDEKARPQRSWQTSQREPPPNRYQKGLIPCLLEDLEMKVIFQRSFVAQCPLDMGQKKKKSNALVIQVDAEKKIINMTQLLNKDSQKAGSFIGRTLTWSPRSHKCIWPRPAEAWWGSYYKDNRKDKGDVRKICITEGFGGHASLSSW